LGILPVSLLLSPALIRALGVTLFARQFSRVIGVIIREFFFALDRFVVLIYSEVDFFYFILAEGRAS